MFKTFSLGDALVILETHQSNIVLEFHFEDEVYIELICALGAGSQSKE